MNEFELDHIIIFTSKGAPEAQRLITFGLKEGPPNTHPGQGTANRRFYFNNIMIELLWVENELEAQNEKVKLTHIFPRWEQRNKSASPFGLCMRPVSANKFSMPFNAWLYKPAYLKEPLAIHIANNSSNIVEPFLFYTNFTNKEDYQKSHPIVTHTIGLSEITNVNLSFNSNKPISNELIETERHGIATFLPSNEHLLELGFDHERRGRMYDFRPELPLTFYW